MTAAHFPFVLAVEDSDEDFDTVLDAARRAGLKHEIRRAATADDCLRMLGEWERERLPEPALVLLDLNTPGTDGREALRIIRKNDRLRTLPLVILSTSANPRDVEFCYAEGANAYHTKPVEHPAHLQVLEEIFDYWLHRVILPSPSR